MIGRQAKMATWLRGVINAYNSRRSSEQDDFGFPEELSFHDYYKLYRRNSIARAVVDRAPSRCWETSPVIVEGDDADDVHDQTPFEKEVADLFFSVSVFARMQAADKRGRVGRYGALYLCFDDAGPDSVSMPVARGARLVKVQPLYESQLKVATRDIDISSMTFGEPLTYNHIASASSDDPNDLNSNNSQPTIHASRVLIFAEGADDGGLSGMSALEAVYNDIISAERIIGACGIGYWRTSRGSLVISGENGSMGELASAFGVNDDEVGGALNEVVSQFTSGSDNALVLGGLNVDQIAFSLPDPEPFFQTALASIAAGSHTPSPILIGEQLSQRASDQNTKAWDRHCKSRQHSFLSPVIETLVQRLIDIGSIRAPNGGFRVHWDDLSSPSAEDRMDVASKMSSINSQQLDDVPFTANEIREAAGYEPLEEIEIDYEEDGAADDPKKQE